jgi:hypothetical protein
VLEPGVKQKLEGKEVDEVSILDEVHEGWKQLSNAIAQGVVNYITSQNDESDFAPIYSSAEQDAEYWNWLSEFVEQFETWASDSTMPPTELQQSLKTFLDSNPAPTQMKGIIKIIKRENEDAN